MVGQAFDLLGQAVSIEGLQGLDNAGMERSPPLLEEAAVGHLVGQGVLESVGQLGEKTRLIEELRRLEVSEAAMEVRLGALGNGLQQQPGPIRTNDRRCLEQALFVRRQPVDACRQNRLYGGWHLQGVEQFGQVIGAPVPVQHPGFYQGAHTPLPKAWRLLAKKLVSYAKREMSWCSHFSAVAC
jgi:hypothetical protein